MRAPIAPLLTCLLGLLAPGPARAVPGPEARQHYRLEARLDADRHVIDGTLELTFVNHAVRSLDTLVLHLYPNAFADAGSVFAREGGLQLRGATLTRSGSLSLSSLVDGHGHDLLATADDELIEGDRTQLRVPLPVPLRPGEAMVLRAGFRTRLPTLVARSGFAGDFHMVAQWFPKLARLRPDGTFRSFPYHGLGEFHADFADYELLVDVPAAHTVAAPGVPLTAEVRDGRRIERYRAERVHDVAFASYPHFRRLVDDATSPTLEVLVPPGQLGGAESQLARLRHQVTVLSRWLGAYPYPRLVLVLPPPGARGAAGMEYPGMMLGWNTPVGYLPGPPARYVREGVTAHELAHQWFSGMLASDEVRHPMLDEGVSEWLGNHLERDRPAPASAASRLLGLPLTRFELLRLRLSRLGDIPSSLLPAHGYGSRRALVGAVYLRPALLLETVRRTWGRDRFDAALGDFARRQRFRHPTTDDLLAALERAYWPGFTARVLRPALEGQSLDLRLERADLAHDPATGYRLALSFTRTSPVPLPSAVAIRHANGSTTRVPWPAAEQELSLVHRSTSAPIHVQADPDGHNLLDPSRANDARALGPAPWPHAVVWRLLGWAQAAMRMVGP